MSKVYSGVKEIGYSDDKATTIAQIGDTVTVTKLTGKVTEDSTTGDEKLTTATTDGAIAGGSSIAPEWGILSRSNFATLEGFEDADTEKYWYLFFFDGRVKVSDVQFNIMVSDSNAVNLEGADSIRITAVKRGITPNIFRQLPAS